MSSFAGASS
jgi:hypothetical protein